MKEHAAETSDMVFSSIHHGKRKQNVPEYCFTWLDVFVVLVSMGTYLADIVTDILVMLVYWKIDEVSWAALTLVFLILPAVVMQVFSTRWYIADGHKVDCPMVFTHLILMGPLKRYINVLCHGFNARKSKRIEDYQKMYSELSDVSMLRLFECFLESAPQLVLQLYIMIRVEGDHILTGISACFSLISLSWAIVAYTKALRAAASKRNRVSWSGMFLQTLWRVGMVTGRVVAIVLFATVFQEWTLLIVGLHWLLMTSWVMAQDTDFCNNWWEEKLFNAVIGVIYVFCFFNMKEGRSRCRASFYYLVMLAENSFMIIMWWPHRTPGLWYNIPALFAVWGGFILGIISMLLYYKFFHPASVNRCHCCLAWYKCCFVCDSFLCCSRNHPIKANLMPYHRSHNSSEDKRDDSTESSEEELDYRDFTDLRCSYNTPTTIHQTCKTEAVTCNKHKCNPNHRHLFPENSRSCGVAIAVLGNAKAGYKVQSFKPSQKQFVKDGTLSKVSMPRPRATSTPGDDLNMKHSRPPLRLQCAYDIKENSRSSTNDCLATNFIPECNDVDTPRTKLAKICETPNTHKPGSPNTLVKNWVRKNHDMYVGKEGCYSDTADNPDVSLDRKQPDHHVTIKCSPNRYNNQKTRKYPIRMKSFSKKDRLKPFAGKKGKHRDSSSFRNSFREAFGFHVIDVDSTQPDEVASNHGWPESEFLGSKCVIDVQPSPKLKQNKQTECNQIKSRHDQPPALNNIHVSKEKLHHCILSKLAIEEKIQYVDETVSNGFGSETSQKGDELFVTAVDPSVYDNQPEDGKSTEKENRTPADTEKNINNHNYSVDRVEYLKKYGKSVLTNLSKDSPARKKLAFRQGSQVPPKVVKESILNKSIEPLGTSMEGVLEDGENYRLRLLGLNKTTALKPRRIALGAIQNTVDNN